MLKFKKQNISDVFDYSSNYFAMFLLLLCAVTSIIFGNTFYAT